MANYNPYYPMGYQPYQMPYYATPTPTAPVVQTPAPTQTSSQPSSIIWVAGERQAAEYPVAPNNAVALWDSTAPSIYLKTADASGKPVLKTYDLVERARTHENGSNLNDTATVGTITQNDLSFVREALNAIQSDIEKIKEGMKRDE